MAAPSPRAPGGVTAPAPAVPAPADGTRRDVPAPKPPAVAPLDLNRLKQQLKDTKAIGLFSKLTLKNQMDDLLDAFREYHGSKGKRSLSDLRRSYDLMVMKVLSLVQDEDQTLASDILASRDAIWALLVDPGRFATLEV